MLIANFLKLNHKDARFQALVIVRLLFLTYITLF